MQNPGSDAGVFVFAAPECATNPRSSFPRFAIAHLRTRRGQYSIRINRQWRVCFRWTPDGPEAIEIADYH
jgi:hypothetical protein